MTLPSIFLAVVIASLIGAGFHLWKGGNFGRLLLYLVLAWVGFGIGLVVGNLGDWDLFTIGPLQTGAGLLGAAALLSLGHWLFAAKRNS